MTTSLKKAPEVTLWGFRFVYHSDTISFLATASISYAVTKIKYSPFTALNSDEELAPSDPNGSSHILIISSVLSAPFYMPTDKGINHMNQYVQQ